MPVPVCLCVRYTDDGCSEYRCLVCKNGWESRTDPQWAGWKSCPYCGDRWQKFIDGENDGKAGRRKELRYRASIRSREAFERRFPPLVLQVIGSSVWGGEPLTPRVEFSSYGWRHDGLRGFLRYVKDEITDRELSRNKDFSFPIRSSYRVVAMSGSKEVGLFPIQPRRVEK